MRPPDGGRRPRRIFWMPVENEKAGSDLTASNQDTFSIDRRNFIRGVAAMATMGVGTTRHGAAQAATEVENLGVSDAAAAIRNGTITAEAFASGLLQRVREHLDLNAFITIDEGSVLEAARAADQARNAGDTLPLLGVPIAVKDSYMTQGIVTTFGTAVLNAFRPDYDAPVVKSLKDAGGVVFGKNNLVEMSFGLTGLNAHHGQPRNPYNKAHVTGGSSSGAGASVAARLVPAALGGDTVGSIRVPASLCGVVGFKPTQGRWSCERVAPISETLDTTGVLARSVVDCALIDAVVTGGRISPPTLEPGLKGIKLGYAPKQHLNVIDADVERLFRDTLSKLRDAGAEITEIDLGDDFSALAERATWGIFFYETRPAVSEFIKVNGIPVTFEQIYEGLTPSVKGAWSAFVAPSAPRAILDEVYHGLMTRDRPELKRLYSEAFAKVDALVFPTTPCAAPRIDAQTEFWSAARLRRRRSFRKTPFREAALHCPE
jgi:indoleacetamide hydrolase